MINATLSKETVQDLLALLVERGVLNDQDAISHFSQQAQYRLDLNGAELLVKDIYERAFQAGQQSVIKLFRLE